jgi:phosphoketolase
VLAEATRVQGTFLRDVMKLNLEARNFRIFGPDETASNRWGALFDVTDRMSAAEILKSDEHVSPDGRVMEMLSEHQMQGWLEGYLLTGRHGFFNCYEAFILHVRGYKEEGTTTTPFDMVVLNDLDRFHLVEDVVDRPPRLGAARAHVKQAMRDRLIEHREYIRRHGDDMPEIRDWQWSE